MDFNILIPPSSTTSKVHRSEVEIFTEILPYHSGSSRKMVEKILLHPLSQTYLNLKWAQTQKFYWFGILLTHLIYSICFSTYSLTMYRVLCPYTNSSPLDPTRFKNSEKNSSCLEKDSLPVAYNCKYLSKLRFLNPRLPKSRESSTIFFFKVCN